LLLALDAAELAVMGGVDHLFDERPG